MYRTKYFLLIQIRLSTACLCFFFFEIINTSKLGVSGFAQLETTIALQNGATIVVYFGMVSLLSCAAYAIGVKFFLVAALCNQLDLLWWYARRMNVLSYHSKLATAGVRVTLGVLFAIRTSLIIWL